MPKATCVQLLPSLVQALGSPSNVVHSYAALCIGRLLASKVGPRLSSARHSGLNPSRESKSTHMWQRP